ncbi:MAG: glycosyltransferase family 4 protein [Candidatus Methylomirabilis oxygeniifera]|uniref:Putative Glycosyl transferase, group 1 n=1 Tax=Methylomirabilis oxygeniifera TaxID=671143 RepID=D5MMF0_METO1|nr:MAG: glycosyltransferase family 4 protein [Candidatus Methylomirabilis oxyfera]CBE70072.1 putative Glycosyl transferase, group 1 [Candidatus Methylomirabilis oxyfera]
MTIGFFTCNASPLLNGLAVSIQQFACHLRRLGHRVFVFAPRYPDCRDVEPDTYRFPSLRVPTHHRYALPIPAVAVGLHRLIPRLGLQIIHTHHPFLVGPYARRLARRLGIPFVFTYHTLYEHYAHYLPVISSLAARLAETRSYVFANQADLVIAPTSGVRERLWNRGVTAPIEVIPTGIEPPGESEESKAQIRRRLGVSEVGPILLYVGRLAREKNLGRLLRAVHSVTRVVPDITLLVVGEGDEQHSLQQLAAHLGVADHVRFVGPVPHQAVGCWYRASDLFVFPSVSETQGLVVLEAMAHGLPVLAVRSVGTSDFIVDGTNGALANDAEDDFIRRLLTLLHDGTSLTRYAEQGLVKAMQMTAEASAIQLVEAYEQLLHPTPYTLHPGSSWTI